MERHLLDTICQTTDYIEKNLQEPMTLDGIARQVNLSKYHLLRIWKGATSTGLMEYVRRRRIACSLGDLLQRRITLEGIASKYAFGSARSYNRLFKEEYGLTPAKWRRQPSELPVFDRFNAEFLHRAGEGIVFYRSTFVLPAFSIAGLEHPIDAADNAANQRANLLGNAFFSQHSQRIINPQTNYVYIGFTSVPTPYTGTSFYQPSLLTSPDSSVPPDMKVKHIKPHKYGVFTYMGAHRPEEISSATLGEIWHQVFEIWMPTVQTNLKETFSFERIDYARCSSDYCECDLFYPITAL